MNNLNVASPSTPQAQPYVPVSRPVESIRPPAPPTPPPVSTPPSEPDHKRMKMVLWVLLALLLVAGVYTLVTREPVAEVEAPQVEIEEVSVEQGRRLSANVFEAPNGFPTFIPVEAGGLYESFKIFYNDENIEQYTVSYYTTSAKTSKWEEYNKFFADNGYRMITESTNKTRGTLYGMKGNTGLLVNIGTENSKTVVKLNHFEKL